MNEVRETLPSNEERLMYIEFCLIYKGEVSRSDITDMFAITSASATRDLIKYNQETNKLNSYFDESRKLHVVKDDTFIPIFKIREMDVLCWIKKEKRGNGDSTLSYRFKRIGLPSQGVLSPLTRAINSLGMAKITYSSLTSGPSERIIAPHSIIDDGLNLYMRAYDRKRDKFLEFSLSRIYKSESIGSSPSKGEKMSDDTEWLRFIDLVLVPHPKIQYKETIEFQYKMIRGELTIPIRSACAGYFLRSWKVDCSEDASLNHHEYHLYLKNNREISDIDSIRKLSPK